MNRWTGERCGIDNCRSRRYHRADDGLVYCQNGHQSSATFETQLENEYVETSQATTRAPRSSPEVSRKAVFLEPREAAQAYLQCLQFVLQGQVRWVAQNVPSTDKLETLVKDLWTIHLQILEPIISKALSVDGPSLFDTQPRAQEATDSVSSMAREFSLVDCCALIYLGCVLLRLPITHRHIHDWINSDAFPFLTTAALIPSSTFLKLPLAYRRTFHARTGVPDPGVLHKATMRVATLHATSNFKIKYPSLNHHLILFDFLVALSLPLDLYPAALKVGECVGCTFTFPSAPQNYKFMADYPELQILCILILTVKLVHPFDGTARSPYSDNEAASLRVDWRKWNRARSRGEMTQVQRNEALVNSTEGDVTEMDGDEMDEYLDWFQATWISDQAEDRGSRADLRRQLGGMFPLKELYGGRNRSPEKRVQANTLQHNVKTVQETLQYVAPVAASKEEVLRPGHDYAHYKKSADLPVVALPFFEAASRLGAVTVDGLTQAVFQMEMKVKKAQAQQR